MGMVLSTLLYNVVSNIIYDIGKCVVGKFQYRKEQFDKQEIEKYVEGKLKNKYENLCESGLLVEYLKLPSVKDIINNYIIYKITGYLSGKLSDIKKKKIMIQEDDVVDFLTMGLMERYENNKTINAPGKSDVSRLFKDIFELSSGYLCEKLEQDQKSVVFFVNNKIDFVSNMMMFKIQEVISILEKSMTKDMIDRNSDFEEVKEHYIKLLKENHNTAHIYLLDRFEINSFYVPPFLKLRCDEKLVNELDFIRSRERYNAFQNREVNNDQFFDDWRYIFDRANIAYITGGAGYGKSLFMNKVITDFENLNVFDSKEYLVIYGELKSFYVNNSENPISVIEFLQNSMTKETLIEKEKITKEFVQYYLNMGRCIILLDALDEVEKSKRKSLHKKVVTYFKEENPNNKICITSRSRGFFPEKEIEVYDIAPLEKTQIETYVNNIIKLGKFDKKDKEAFLEQSNTLVEKGFLCSFLILSLLINIYKAERELPENKLELYQKCFEYIANKREKEKTQEKSRWKAIAPLMKDNTFMELSNLCLPNNAEADKETIKNTLMNVYKTKYSSEVETEDAVDEFLAFCADRTELFVPSAGEDKFKFFHRSFFEYFYSQYVFIRKDSIEEIYECISNFDVDSEIFELTFAMLKQKNEFKYQKLIEFIFSILLDDEIDKKRLGALNILILGMQVIDDEAYKKKLVDFIVDESEFVFKNKNDIHSQRILTNIITCNSEYLSIVNEKYKEKAILSLLLSFANIFQEVKNVSVELLKESKKDELVEYIRFRYRRFYYDGFYTQTYFYQNSIKELFEELTIKQIETLCKNNKISRKNTNKLTTVFTEYLKQDSSFKNKIDELIFDEDSSI